MIFRFLHPWFFAALILAPLIVLAYFRLERGGRARVVFSDLSVFREIKPSLRVRLRHVLIGLRTAAICLMVIGLARPQYGNRTQEILSKGIDIMIVLDNSTSMQAPDLDPDRLTVAKQVIDSFIDAREESLQNDRIGLVAFSAIAFTRCPLTVDYTILKQIVSGLSFTRKEFDGTAIGSAIATAVGRLDQSKAKSKIIILVTDGQNNMGIDPLVAAEMAKSLGIKIYTVGVVPTGLMGKVQNKIFGTHFQPMVSQVDESQMKQIAELTEGRYFRATNESGFKEVFEEIDKMEKTEVKVKEFYRYAEAYLPWAALAFVLLTLEQLLARTVLRRIP